jgi:hypothetical protein
MKKWIIPIIIKILGSKDSINGLENWPYLIVLSLIIDGMLPEL